jgi:hypothetical protein
MDSNPRRPARQTTGDDDDSEVDISHEALMRSWTRLSGPRRDFAAGWLREERDDGELWRGYVNRTANGPRLTLSGLWRIFRWLRRRSLGEAWSRRYGNRWEDVKKLRVNSLLLRVSLLVAIVSFSAVGVYFAAIRFYEARYDAMDKETRALAALARAATYDNNPQEGIKLALAAWPRSSKDIGRPQKGSPSIAWREPSTSALHFYPIDTTVPCMARC